MSTGEPIFLRAALEYAARGIPIFPCIEGGKKPATAHGHKDATTDAEQIRAWAEANPNYNIGTEPDSFGCAVIDADLAKSGCEFSNLVFDLPDTRVVRTPSGGEHWYYKGSLPPSASKLAKGVDTRGRHSYVLLPPSIVGGNSYEVLHDRPIATLPADIAARFTHSDKQVATDSAKLDSATDIARARDCIRDYVRRGDVAVLGQGGDTRTYRLAAEVQDLGVSPATCLRLLTEEWNPHCKPPFLEHELETLAKNANNHMQNTPGSKAAGDPAEVFKDYLSDPATMVADAEVRSRFYFEDDEEQDMAPDPEWIIRELIPDRSTILVLGKSGSFKSFLVQDIALAIAAGKPTCGEMPIRWGCPTFYGAHEVRDAIRKSRKHAWKVAHEVTTSIPFYVGRGPHVISPEECAEFKEQIRARLRNSRTKIGLIVLDTVAKCMPGLNENDATDVGQFIAFVDSLRDEFECSVVCLHHLGKDETRGGRGSTAFTAGFDTTLRVTRHDKTTVVKIDVVQHATAPERETPFCFEGLTVGEGLVFQPISEIEYIARTSAENLYSGQLIGAALQSLKAFGKSNGVATHALATTMFPLDELESETEWQAKVDRHVRALQNFARGALAPYCSRAGRGIIWHLPPRDILPEIEVVPD